MNHLELLYSRRSMRKYTDQPVTEKELYQILKAAMLAPSSKNGQPWHFVVVKAQTVREQMMEHHPNMTFAKYADAVILVCADSNKAPLAMAYTDCAAATQNILLAAHALGLGACWCAVHPYEDRQQAFADLCGVPDDIKVFAAVTLGRPGKENPPIPENRIDEDRIHLEKW